MKIKTIKLIVAMALMGVLPAMGQLLPYQDTSLSFHERAVDLVSRLSLEEKAAQMGNMVDININRRDFHDDGYVRSATAPYRLRTSLR